MPGFADRIGIDFGARLPIEAAITRAGRAGVRVADIRLGDTGNEFATFDDARVGAVRRAGDAAGLEIGLHTLSAVNVGETAPFLREAVDDYLTSYIDIAARLGAGWIVMHGGFHFTGDYARRMATAIERLQRLGELARRRGVRLLLENMNPEPMDAEVRYLACDIEETRHYFDRLDPSAYGWSFTVNHAHMLPCGIAGFFDAFGPARLEEVRLADNRGGKEEHLRPGEGNVDFEATFALIEASGYRGHYMLAWEGVEEMIEDRALLAARAERVLAVA